MGIDEAEGATATQSAAIKTSVDKAVGKVMSHVNLVKSNSYAYIEWEEGYDRKEEEEEAWTTAFVHTRTAARRGRCSDEQALIAVCRLSGCLSAHQLQRACGDTAAGKSSGRSVRHDGAGEAAAAEPGGG